MCDSFIPALTVLDFKRKQGEQAGSTKSVSSTLLSLHQFLHPGSCFVCAPVLISFNDGLWCATVSGKKKDLSTPSCFYPTILLFITAIVTPTKASNLYRQLIIHVKYVNVCYYTVLKLFLVLEYLYVHMDKCNLLRFQKILQTPYYIRSNYRWYLIKSQEICISV